jgi:hypothetical protein
LIALSQIDSERGYLAAIGQAAAQGIGQLDTVPVPDPDFTLCLMERMNALLAAESHRSTQLDIRCVNENGRAVEEVVFRGSVIHRVYV